MLSAASARMLQRPCMKGLRIARRSHETSLSRNSLNRNCGSLFSTSPSPCFVLTPAAKTRVILNRRGEPRYEFDEVDGKIMNDGIPVREELVAFPLPYDNGYKRVQINDFIGPNLRICRKLGWTDRYNTWLAQDHRNEDYLVVQILTEHYKGGIEIGLSHYPSVLHHVSAQMSQLHDEHVGTHHIVRPVTDFSWSDADHQAFAFLPVGPSLADIRRKDPSFILTPQIGRVFSRQILHALHFLHDGCQIIHDGILLDNIFIQSPQSNKQGLTELLKEEPPAFYPGPTYTMPLREEMEYRLRHPEDDSPVLREIPELMSQPLPAPPLDKPNNLVFKVGHLDSARQVEIGTLVRAHYLNIWARCPERVLSLPWNEKVDIFEFGCSLFDLLTGEQLLPFPPSVWREDEDVFMYLQKMSGRISIAFPEHVIRAAQKGRPIPFNGFYKLSELSFPDYSPSDVRHRLMLAGITGQDLEMISAFIRRCLTLDPKERPSAKELLQDPWLQ